MTPEECDLEWQFRYKERVSILAEDREPTENQKRIAAREANEAVLALALEDEKTSL